MNPLAQHDARMEADVGLQSTSPDSSMLGERMPHLVSSGAQYNYRAWLANIEHEERLPDEAWYRALIA